MKTHPRPPRPGRHQARHPVLRVVMLITGVIMIVIGALFGFVPFVPGFLIGIPGVLLVMASSRRARVLVQQLLRWLPMRWRKRVRERISARKPVAGPDQPT